VPQTETLINTVEAADSLGVSVTTVNRWAASGKLPIVRKLSGDTGAYVFDRSDVEALRADRKGSAA
jgi:excisionase family DNA binding protein